MTDHIHDRYITTSEFNTLTSENFTATLKWASLASESKISNFVKEYDFQNKLKEVTLN